jgi:hypothetical protein
MSRILLGSLKNLIKKSPLGDFLFLDNFLIKSNFKVNIHPNLKSYRL